MNWMVFYSEHALDSYIWDGVYPIGLGVNRQTWNDLGEVTEKEVDFFNSIANNPRKKLFEIKGRGRFIIQSRGPFLTT